MGCVIGRNSQTLRQLLYFDSVLRIIKIVYFLIAYIEFTEHLKDKRLCIEDLMRSYNVSQTFRRHELTFNETCD